MGPFLIGEDESDLESNASMQLSKFGSELSPQDLFKRLATRNAPCGRPEDLVAKLNEKREAGIDRFYFQTLVPENTGMIRLLAETLHDRF